MGRTLVNGLLDGGELPFFEVCGERRVFMESVMNGLGERVNATQAGVLGNSVNQARAMPSEIADDNALVENLAKLGALTSTFGESLRDTDKSAMVG